MTRNADLHTILRHLVSNTQWGGNQGEKAETMEALDRLTDNRDEETQTAADVNAKEPDVGGGSVPGDQTASGTKRTGTVAKR